MKKSYLVMAAAAALFAACSSNDLAEEKSPQTTQQTNEQAVVFDAYTSRGTTRAGMPGVLDNDKLQASTSDVTASNGFGVFGYYTNNVPYGQTAIPDFFYNQKVYYNTSKWEYSPIKYWPNEFGTDAESTGQDKLTFFAYAPYVQVTPGTGRVKGDEKSGIVGMTSNSAAGDPYLKYIVDFDPDNSVDLCYGVANSNFTSSVDGDNNNVEAGKPYIDVIKPKITDKIHFNFKHALASLNVQIDADIDELSHGSVNYLDGNTKIFVRKVTFEGFAEKGSLNLNSEGGTDYVPNWFELNSINRRLSSGTVTIYDGRRDGREGQANATASNETPNALNEKIIQKETETDGVPATEQVNLFNSTTATKPIFVIPTDENLKVTIVYDVETKDDNLSTYLSDGKTKGSTVENTITKAIKISDAEFQLQAGKAYVVTLHLGMTSVKFDAEVTAWPTATNTDNTDLPINSNGTFGANQTHTMYIPAASTGGEITVSGLTDGSSYTAAATSIVSAVTPASGTQSGTELTLNYTVPANTTFYKQSGKVTLTETGAAETETTINIVQSAQALGLSVTDVNAAGTVITLASTGAFENTTDWTNVAKTKWTVVKKTAAGVTSSPTYTPAGTSTTGAKITLTEEVSAGDEYIITIQTGEAAAETVTVKIGGIAFASATDAATATAGDKVQPQTPTIYGNGIIAADGWVSGTVATATIDSATGELTVVAAGTTEVTANLTAPGSPDGYFYTTNSKKASYTLTITAPAP